MSGNDDGRLKREHRVECGRPLERIRIVADDRRRSLLHEIAREHDAGVGHVRDDVVAGMAAPRVCQHHAAATQVQPDVAGQHVGGKDGRGGLQVGREVGPPSRRVVAEASGTHVPGAVGENGAASIVRPRSTGHERDRAEEVVPVRVRDQCRPLQWRHLTDRCRHLGAVNLIPAVSADLAQVPVIMSTLPPNWAALST